MDLPCSHPPSPAVLSPSISHPRKRPFEKMCKMKRDEGEDWSALHLCKEGIAFLLFVREEINSIHIIKFWQGETLSADIEKWQECFKACLSSFPLLSFCIFSPTTKSDCIISLISSPHLFFHLYSALFLVCLLWKGREWAASLTSWHHISCLSLETRAFCFHVHYDNYEGPLLLCIFITDLMILRFSVRNKHEKEIPLSLCQLKDSFSPHPNLTFMGDSQGDGVQSVTTILPSEVWWTSSVTEPKMFQKKKKKCKRLIYLQFGLIIWSLNPNPVTLHERPLKGPLTLLVITQPPSFQCSSSSHGCPMAHQPPPCGLQQVFLPSSPLPLPLPLSLSLVSVAPGERLILDIQRIAAFVSEI